MACVLRVYLDQPMGVVLTRNSGRWWGCVDKINTNQPVEINGFFFFRHSVKQTGHQVLVTVCIAKSSINRLYNQLFFVFFFHSDQVNGVLVIINSQ